MTVGLAALCLAGALGFSWVLDQSPEWSSSLAARVLTVRIPQGFAAIVLCAAAWTQGRAGLAWARLRRNLAAPSNPEFDREQADLAGLRARDGGPIDFGPEVYSSGQDGTPAKIKP